MFASTISGVKQGVATFVSQPWLVILSSLIDALFLFLYGFFTQPVRDNVILNGVNLAQATATVMQESAARYETPSVMQVLLEPSAKPHLLGLIISLLVLFVISYLVYVLLQAIVWKLAGSPHGWIDHLTQFALVNVVWFTLLGGLRVVLMIVDLRNSLVFAMTDTPASPVLRIIVLVLMSIVVYLMALSYAELHKHHWLKSIKHAIKRGFTDVRHVIVPCLALLCFFLLVNLIVRWLLLQNATFGLIFGVVVLLPLLFFSRIYVKHIVGLGHAGQHA